MRPREWLGRLHDMWSPPAGVAGDAALVRRAALVVAAQTAAAVAIVVAVVGLLALSFTTRAQGDDTQATLRQAALTADTAGEPPRGVWLLVRTPDGKTTSSPGTPRGLARAEVSGLPSGRGELDPPDGPDYEVFTVDRGGRRVVAAVDLRFGHEERDRLIAALLAAGGVGIIAAAAAGWIIGKRAVRPLGSALALQRRFVADASHELRTPLTILHTRAQLLQQRGGGDAKTMAGLDRLVADTRALTEIVNDLLLSAEMQGRPDNRQPVELRDVADRVVEDFSTTAQAAEVTLGVEAGAPASVAGVPVALRRAVSALVDNALAHTRPGGAVTISVRTEGRHAVLAVIDDGEGLDPAEAAALTERFARGPARSSGQGRRFGLGLALVREVVHAHGGTLSLDGRPGAGATATITLPLTSP